MSSAPYKEMLRPLGKEHTVSRLLRVMQCLSRIEEGEKLGMAIFLCSSRSLCRVTLFSNLYPEGFGVKVGSYVSVTVVFFLLERVYSLALLFST